MPLLWPRPQDSQAEPPRCPQHQTLRTACLETPAAGGVARRVRAMSDEVVVGVLSGCGGAGASVLAATIAGCAAESAVNSGRHSSGASDLPRTPRPAFLIDCDRMGGGIDVLLGAEGTAGPRWRQVRLRGGELASQVLVDMLPRWGDVRFLAAD